MLQVNSMLGRRSLFSLPNKFNISKRSANSIFCSRLISPQSRKQRPPGTSVDDLDEEVLATPLDDSSDEFKLDSVR